MEEKTYNNFFENLEYFCHKYNNSSRNSKKRTLKCLDTLIISYVIDKMRLNNKILKND